MSVTVYPVDGLTDDKVQEYINAKKPFSIKSVSADDYFIYKVETYISLIFKKKKYHHLNTPVNFVIQELIQNANKANLKRVYFNLNNYDIDDKNNEDKVKAFTGKIKKNTKELEQYLEQYNFYIKVIFQEYSRDKLVIYVINNAELTENEKTRIKEKFDFYDHVNEEPQKSLNIIDDREGAGMGLFLSLKLLDKTGINKKALSIGTYKNDTIARLSFFYKDVKPPEYNIIAQEILKEIESLPKYPENVKNLIALTDKPEVTITEISNHITKDPSLSADLLKLVNSAEYALNRKIASIREAINYIGLKGLKNLLYSHGAIQAMNSRFGSVREIWDHCYKTALFASKIAKNAKFEQNLDEFFTAGLLHDIGKIVLMNFDENQVKKIENVCRQRGVDMPVMEEIILGLTHARIGGKIARYWDFPESLIYAISYHHDPVAADLYKELVYTVYIANIFASARTKNLSIYDLEPLVAQKFHIKNTDDLLLFRERIEKI